MIVATPDFPPELAAMCTVPSAIAVTTPVPDTVAIEVFSELQKKLGDHFGTERCVEGDRGAQRDRVGIGSDGDSIAPTGAGGVASTARQNDNRAMSAERGRVKFDRRAARIEHSLWRESHARARVVVRARAERGGTS